MYVKLVTLFQNRRTQKHRNGDIIKRRGFDHGRRAQYRISGSARSRAARRRALPLPERAGSAAGGSPPPAAAASEGSAGTRRRRRPRRTTRTRTTCRDRHPPPPARSIDRSPVSPAQATAEHAKQQAALGFSSW
jgi:hypothetical protein